MRPLRVLAEPAFRTAHANPYNALLYRAVQREGVEVEELSYVGVVTRKPDVVHIHWPELMFLSGHRRARVIGRVLLFGALLSIARLRGTRLMWTVHNIESHEARFSPRLRAWVERWFVRNVDGFCCLTEGAVAATRARYPGLGAVPAFVTPHGHYRDQYPKVDRAVARAALGVPGAVRFVVSVGQIRPYKNVQALITASAALGRADVIVGIAGKPSDPALRAEIEALAARRGDVRLRLEFVPDEDIAVWLAAADLVVLPYRAIQNSGSALLALSADRPVVVPDAGAMRELQRVAGGAWVHLFEGAFTADALAAALQAVDGRSADRAERAGPDLRALDWDRIAALTVAAYRDVVGSPARNGDETYGAQTADTIPPASPRLAPPRHLPSESSP